MLSPTNRRCGITWRQASIAAVICVSLAPVAAWAQIILPQGLTCGLDHTNRPFGANVALCRGHATLLRDAAPGLTIVPDGDYGMPSGQGFFHQELTSSAEGIIVGVPSDEHYWESLLPQGTVCGFHHTRNSPNQTCMGYNPANACPAHWEQKRYFDMSSDTGFWVWCEYQNPLHYFVDPPIAGLVCGLGGDTSNAPNEIGFCFYGRVGGDSGAPRGWTSTVSFFDQGRPSDQGLGWAASDPASGR
jgi:hypothetical protein